MAEPRRFGWYLAWLPLGLGLVLLSGPIGDWYDYLHQLWSGMSPVSGHKFDSSLGLDRIPGWLVLGAGWCCIAHGLGGAREPPRGVTTGFARMRFRLRWLPVPILGTLGTYVGLAYHHVAPLVLTVDVENVPPGATFEGGVIVGRSAWHWSRYGATFDYLFAVNLPPYEVRTSFSNQAHAQFRFAAGWLSLQNWQPDLERVFVGIEDGSQDNAAFLLLRVEHGLQHADTIHVTHRSLAACQSPERTNAGACLIQVAPLWLDEGEVRVVFDLADVELEPFDEGPFYRVDLLWGPKR